MNWQSIVAWLIVALAGLWLARRVARIVAGPRDGESQTGGCAACPKKPETVKATPLVQLGERKEP